MQMTLLQAHVIWNTAGCVTQRLPYMIEVIMWVLRHYILSYMMLRLLKLLQALLKIKDGGSSSRR